MAAYSVEQLKIKVILGAEKVDTTFFQQAGAHPHTVNRFGHHALCVL
jgi:hypothetical protein